MKQILLSIAVALMAFAASAQSTNKPGVPVFGAPAAPPLTANYYGIAIPNGSLTAGFGSIYIQNTNGILTQWVKTNNSGNTGWSVVLPLVITNSATVINAAMLAGSLPSVYMGWTNQADLHVTPQQFGALADNAHDDTAAIQAAIDSVSLTNSTPATVFFPPGTYKVTASLVLHSNGIATTDTRKAYSLRGVPGASIINYTPTTGNCIQFSTLDVGHLNRFSMSGLWIIGAGLDTNKTSVGVYLGYDPSIVPSADKAGWDDTISRCKIFGFKQGAYINSLVEATINNECEIQGNWWTPITMTNCDSSRITDCALGDPQLGVTNATFTNLCAGAEIWLGVGNIIENCEVGRGSRSFFNNSGMVKIIGGNNEDQSVEYLYSAGAAAHTTIIGPRLAGIGDGTTNSTLFHFGDLGDAGCTVISPSLENAGNDRLVAVDATTYAYTQPNLIFPLAGSAPARYTIGGTTNYFPLVNNLTRNTWFRDVSPATPDFSGGGVTLNAGLSPSPIFEQSAALCPSNTASYIGIKVPHGLGFTKVRSTITLEGDASVTGMHVYINPNILRYPSSGFVSDGAGQAYVLNGINSGATKTLQITNSWNNDTDPREMYIRLYNDAGLTTGITNKVWITKWQVEALQ